MTDPLQRELLDELSAPISRSTADLRSLDEAIADSFALAAHNVISGAAKQLTEIDNRRFNAWAYVAGDIVDRVLTDAMACSRPSEDDMA